MHDLSSGDILVFKHKRLQDTDSNLISFVVQISILSILVDTLEHERVYQRKSEMHNIISMLPKSVKTLLFCQIFHIL